MKVSVFLSIRLLTGLGLLLSLFLAQPPVTSSAQDDPVRLILEKLGAKARQYRENHAFLLRTVSSQSQLFKDDLVTPKGKPWGFEAEAVVVRRSLPSNSAETGLFLLSKWKKANVKNEQWQKPKAWSFVSEVDFLLPEKQAQFTFSLQGQETLQGRAVYVLSFVPVKIEPPKVVEENGKKHVTAAPTKGRIWVDTESYDILQIAWSLLENYQVHFDLKLRPDADFTLERNDFVLKFKPYNLGDEGRALWLPASAETIRLTRGSTKPGYKQWQKFEYKRFDSDIKLLDDIEIVPDKSNYPEQQKLLQP